MRVFLKEIVRFYLRKYSVPSGVSCLLTGNGFYSINFSLYRQGVERSGPVSLDKGQDT